MAIELGPHKIRVNSVNPGPLLTDMVKNIQEEDMRGVVQTKTPTGTTYMPMSDVVSAVVFLAGDSTCQITGESLAIDGGFLAT